MEDEIYSPKSDFVWPAANGEVPLGATPEGQANLKLLIAFTEDSDMSNRDFATMALAMHDADTPEIRAALLRAADDEDRDVRGEAIEGLAKRNREIALPLVQRELAQSDVGYGVFVAAAILADASLVEPLRRFDYETDSPWVDDTVREAIGACETGIRCIC